MGGEYLMDLETEPDFEEREEIEWQEFIQKCFKAINERFERVK